MTPTSPARSRTPSSGAASTSPSTAATPASATRATTTTCSWCCAASTASTPRPGLLNVEWIISHPDMIDPDEVAAFDLVYAASTSWSARMTPRVGHPGRAAAPVHRHPVVPPRPRRARHRPGAAVRGQLARRLPLRRAQRARDRRRPHAARQRLDRVRRARADRLGRGGQPARSACSTPRPGVVLNDHHLDMRRDSFASNRLFDAAACGARILSDRIDGLEETFSGLVLPFDNEHELARLVQPPYDAFPDNETRREIATRIIVRAQLRQARRAAHRRRRTLRCCAAPLEPGLSRAGRRRRPPRRTAPCRRHPRRGRRA